MALPVLSFIALLAASTGSGELVLKERACIQGRFVRLVDLLDPARGSEADRRRLADVWMGRAPEEGSSRCIGIDDIRRELERRGFDPDTFTFVGRDVRVERGAEPEAEALRRALAFEVKKLILEKEGLRGDEVAVRISQILPRPAAGAELVDVRDDGAGFVARFSGGVESRILAQLLRFQERAFAAKDVPAGKTLDREDVEWRRIESDDRAGTPETVLGVAAASRLRKGAPIGAADLRQKPVVRRGDVVRLVSAAFEVDARALEDGGPGQEVEVEVAASKARLRGRVAGAGKVEIR